MPDTDKHDEARKLAEEALGKYAEGDEKTGDKLASEAAKLDRSAVEEVVADIDEDADANHDPDAIAKATEG